MFRKSIAAAVLVAGAAFAPAAANAATGYTTQPTELLAGPDEDYPVIRPVGGDRRVEIFGCLNDWSYCDVGYRSDRGWIDGRDVVVDYRSRRTSLYNAGAYVGIGFVSFSFGNYWDSYYRGRPFYRERGRWERHYHDHYRASWGPRRDRDWNNRDRRDWNDRDRRDWNDRDRRDGRDGNRDNDRRDNDRRGDNDRRDNDRTVYKGAPPAVTTPSPQPRPGLNDRDDRPSRGERDNDRGRDRNTSPAVQPTPQATTTPSPAPGNDRPNRGVNERPDRGGGNDRPDRGAGNDRPDRGAMGMPNGQRPGGDRQAMERPDRGAAPGANDRRERPQQGGGAHENRQPRPNRGDNDDENRPGR